MRRAALLFIGTNLAAAVAIAPSRARAQEAPAPQIGFWETVAKPHARRVARLMADGMALRDRAAQYAEPQQLAERNRLLEEALGRFERAQALDPGNLSVVRQVGLTAFEVGAWGKASAALAQAHREEPDDGTILQPLAMAYMKVYRWDDAIDVCNRALGGELAVADRQTITRQLGYAYMGEGRLEDAIDAYDRAARAQVGSGQTDLFALTGLAVAYDRDEQLGRAAEVLEQVRQLDASFSHLTEPQPQAQGFAPLSDRHYWLALAYETTHKLPEAASEWRAYLAAPDPTYRRRAEEHLHEVLVAMKQPKGAPVAQPPRLPPRRGIP